MASNPEQQELRSYLRGDPAPEDAVVVVRGGPASLERLSAHALRTRDAFLLDGEPVLGISVFCALDDIGPASLDALLRRFSSYRVVHLPHAGQLRAAGFDLLDSFGRPHYTLRLHSLGDVAQLLDALGPAEANPYHGRRPGRR